MMDIAEIIAIRMLKGIGDAFIRKNLELLRHCSSGDDFLCKITKQPEDIERFPDYLNNAIAIVDECHRKGIHILSILADDYPQALLELTDPPAVIYARGNLKLVNNCIAIIGTRHSTDSGNAIARRVAAYFVNNFAICNGLVEGIDENAIRPNGQIASNVVGVISGGILYEETCSNRHKEIIHQVLDSGGLILSDMYPHQKEDAFSGIKVSRIQAGLSKGMILIQSSVDGGSKYTLKAFSKLQRALGVICNDRSPEYETDAYGANRLILDEGIEGLVTLTEVKKDKIAIKDIIRISSRQDYEVLNAAIHDNSESLF